MDHEDEFVAMLRELCQGRGMTPYRLVELMSTYGFADGADADDLYRRIEVASSLVGDPRHRAAIRNALGFGYEDEQLTLTDRRTSLLSEKDLSLRTLIRHEQEGAAALAAQMDNVDEYFSKDDPTASRIDDLEMLVMLLFAAVDKLSENSQGELDSLVEVMGPINTSRFDRAMGMIDRRWKFKLAQAGASEGPEAQDVE